MHLFNQSPKYPLRWKELRKTFGQARLKEKWTKKVRHQVKNSFFPDPIDFLDIHVNISAYARRLRDEISGGGYLPGVAARYRVEKSRGLCRLMVSPHPQDLLLLQSLSDTLYHQIKEAAPSENAFFEPQDHSFSRMKGEEPEYGTFESWKKFHTRILGFQQEANYVVVTDIANYYDFIDFNSLRNVLAARKKINESMMDFLIFILRNLSWQPDFMPYRSSGLPQIDADAPRLLAHAYLFELDAFIESKNKRQYARFMDDIDAGVASISEAKKLLRDIDLVLQSRNLRLNAGKTRILSAADALLHFKVRENALLDRFDQVVSGTVAKGNSPNTVVGRLLAVAVRMLEKKRFDDGNGEKIYKRVLGYAYEHRVPLPEKLFHDAVFNRPALRDSAFRNAAHCGFGSQHLQAATEYLVKGLACDDAFQMNLCKRLTSGRLIYDGTEVENMKRLIKHMETESAAGIHSVLWILSRYAKPSTFLKTAKRLVERRALHPFTYRLIGGFAARIASDSSAMQQLRLIAARIRDRGAETVFEYVYDLTIDKKAWLPIFATLKAPNPTSPLKYSHSKYLLLRAVLSNPNLPSKDRTLLLNRHSEILSERSYSEGGLF